MKRKTQFTFSLNIKIIMLSFIYFFSLLISAQFSNIISSLIMSITFAVGFIYIYDYGIPLLSMKNGFFMWLFCYGIYYRYIYILIIPGLLYESVPAQLVNMSIYHIKTSLVILLFSILYALGLNIYKRKIGIVVDSSKLTLNNIFGFKYNIVYVILLTIGYTYKLANIRYATSTSFGSLDTFFSIFTITSTIMSYVYLVSYFQRKDHRCLYMYLIGTLPSIIYGTYSGMKGALLWPILYFIIIMSLNGRKYKIRYIVILLIVYIIANPLVSIYRTNIQVGYTIVDMNIENIVEYMKLNNVVRYTSNRFAYYDLTYYVVNVGNAALSEFRAYSGLIHERFIGGLIPRMFFPNKPIVNEASSIAYILLKLNPLIYNNLTVGYIGDIFASYGTIGVGIFAYITGVSFGKIEYIRRISKNILTYTYCIYSGICLLQLLEGDIAAKMISYLISLLSLICIRLLFGKKYFENEMKNKVNDENLLSIQK